MKSIERFLNRVQSKYRLEVEFMPIIHLRISFFLFFFYMTIFGFFCIIPLIEKYFERKIYFNEVKRNQEFLQTKSDVLTKASSFIALNKDKVEALENFLPNDPHLESLLLELVGVGSNSSFETKKPSVEGRNAATQEILLTLDAVGSLDLLPTYLKNLESMTRLVKLESVSTHTDNDGFVSVRISLKTFILKEVDLKETVVE